MSKKILKVEPEVIEQNAHNHFDNTDAAIVIDFAKRVNHLMDERGITQETIAKHLDCSPNSFYKYRTGKSQPTLTSLVKLADYLDVDCNDLIKGENKFVEELGLNQEALALLHYLNQSENDKTISLLNRVLSLYYRLNYEDVKEHAFVPDYEGHIDVETIFSMMEDYVNATEDNIAFSFEDEQIPKDITELELYKAVLLVRMIDFLDTLQKEQAEGK